MDTSYYLQFALALVFVLALIGIVGWILKRTMGSGSKASGNGWFKGKTARLGVVEASSIDGRRKVVLVRRDDVEHLVMIGGPIDLVVETGIEAEKRPTADTAETSSKGGAEPRYSGTSEAASIVSNAARAVMSRATARRTKPSAAPHPKQTPPPAARQAATGTDDAAPRPAISKERLHTFLDSAQKKSERQ